MISRYYYTDIGDTKSVIVLGDFGVNGWQLCRDKVNLSLEHCLLACEYNLIVKMSKMGTNTFGFESKFFLRRIQ